MADIVYTRLTELTDDELLVEHYRASYDMNAEAIEAVGDEFERRGEIAKAEWAQFDRDLEGELLERHSAATSAEIARLDDEEHEQNAADEALHQSQLRAGYWA